MPAPGPDGTTTSTTASPATAATTVAAAHPGRPATARITATSPGTMSPTATTVTTPTAPGSAPAVQPPLADLQRLWGNLGRDLLIAGQRDLSVAIAGSRLMACEAGTASISLAPSRGAAAPVDLTLLHPYLGTLHPWVRRLVPAAVEADPDAAARARRYRDAEANGIVRALQKCFTAEVVGRELLARAQWLERQADRGAPDPTAAEPGSTGPGPS